MNNGRFVAGLQETSTQAGQASSDPASVLSVLSVVVLFFEFFVISCFRPSKRHLTPPAVRPSVPVGQRAAFCRRSRK